jgi:hypothetical protein
MQGPIVRGTVGQGVRLPAKRFIERLLVAICRVP